jgi:hypothetical protein
LSVHSLELLGDLLLKVRHPSIDSVRKAQILKKDSRRGEQICFLRQLRHALRVCHRRGDDDGREILSLRRNQLIEGGKDIVSDVLRVVADQVGGGLERARPLFDGLGVAKLVELSRQRAQRWCHHF